MTHAFEPDAKRQAADHALIAATVAIVLATLAISGAYASIHGRGLYQDGAYHLLRMTERDWFYLVNPPRLTVEAMRQAPVVLARQLGELSLFRLAQIFSAAMLALPLLLTAACWFIAPKDQKLWVLLPAIHLLVGFSTMSFEAVGEAAIAAGYVWVLLFLLVFRTRALVSQFCFIALCVPAFQLSESAVLLMPVLGFAIGLRAPKAASWAERIFLAGSALLTLAIAIYELGWIIHPRLPGEPTGALFAILSFGFLTFEGRVNLPVITAFGAVLALGATLFFHATLARSDKRLPAAAAIAFCLFALATACIAWQIDGSITPRGQSLARYNPIFATLVLGTLLVVGVHREGRAHSWARGPTFAVITALALSQMTADVRATILWRSYLHDIEERLAHSRGPVEWAGTAETGDAARDANWQVMTADWVHPIISIILAQDGDVRAILDYPPGTAFRPLDLSDPEKLPHIRGVSFAHYRQSVESSARALDRIR